jgi:hypothetical protein
LKGKGKGGGGKTEERRQRTIIFRERLGHMIKETEQTNKQKQTMEHYYILFRSAPFHYISSIQT